MAFLPSQDFKDFLNGQFGLIDGTNLAKGPLDDSETKGGFQDNMVFVRSLGGLEPERTMGEVDEFRDALLSITVRNRNHATGDALAQSIVNSTNGLSALPVGYSDAVPTQAAPQELGQDDKGRYLFLVVMRVKWLEVT